MTRVRAAAYGVGLVLGVLSAGCSDHPSTAPAGVTSAVKVQDNQYTPAAANVMSGDVVVWEWQGSNLHTVSFDDGQASTAQVHGQYQRKFTQPGEYRYHCAIHGLSMSGSVTVK